MLGGMISSILRKLVPLGTLVSVLMLFDHLKKPPPAVLRGLVKNGWYRILFRSSLNAHDFGLAAGQQVQHALGLQEFDVRLTTADQTDPYVYRATGIYRGSSGDLADAPGIVLLDMAMASPIASAGRGFPLYLDARPVMLRPGSTYYGRASISWPASMFASDDKIIAALSDAGFSHATIIRDASKLPPEWPASERGGDIFFVVVYGGEAKSADLPSQVISLWTLPS